MVKTKLGHFTALFLFGLSVTACTAVTEEQPPVAPVSQASSEEELRALYLSQTIATNCPTLELNRDMYEPLEQKFCVSYAMAYGEEFCTSQNKLGLRILPLPSHEVSKWCERGRKKFGPEGEYVQNLLLDVPEPAKPTPRAR